MPRGWRWHTGLLAHDGRVIAGAWSAACAASVGVGCLRSRFARLCLDRGGRHGQASTSATHGPACSGAYREP